MNKAEFNEAVLVLGSGGREHALVRHLRANGYRVYCAPGSDGISTEAECFSFQDFSDLFSKIQQYRISKVIVGPEQYLADGVSDFLESKNIFVFGPNRYLAQLETDKSFSKDFMLKNKIPTARAVSVRSSEELTRALSDFRPPYVVKAAGLAQGKGVWIGGSASEAQQVGEDFLKQHQSLVIEDFLSGMEMSAFYLVDGDHFIYLGSAQDHKRLSDGDQGPNTGGMGALSPSPLDSKSLQEQIETEIVRPTLDGIRKEGRRYRGFLFLGLMIEGNGSKKEIRLLEYNCRMGDPETQCLFQRIDSDLIDLLEALKSGRAIDLKFAEGIGLTVVIASKGYPQNPAKGFSLGKIESPNNISIVHSGTKKEGDHWIASGGRLFTLNTRANSLIEARETIYSWLENASDLPMDKVHFRKDIGGTWL